MRPKNVPAKVNTELKFLDSAERLFAERGFGGASVRAIANAAGANLGALHYYWGTKEELFRAVWNRRLAPRQEERERQLAECLAKANHICVTIEEVLIIIIENGLGVFDGRDSRSEYFDQLYARAISDPSPAVKNIVNEYFEKGASGFMQLIRLACPTMTDRNIYWGLHAVFGSILNLHIGGNRVDNLMGGPAQKLTSRNDVKAAAQSLVTFHAAGFRALSAD